MNNRAIEVRGLQVQRGATHVFDGLDADIAGGSITGVLGPSGCGKTTLLRSIVGVQKVRAGTVTVLGAPAGSRGLRRRVSYATQSAAIYDEITVRENLAYFARILGVPRSEVARVIDVVGLNEQATQLVGALSGGQHNRVSLAVALLGSPDLIVLDEPTVGLDPLLRAELWDTFRAIVDAGSTMIVSSHVMDEAARCDRLLLMRDGRLVADTTPAGLLADTGAADAEEAFLTLVRRHGGSEKDPSPASSGAADMTSRARSSDANPSPGAPASDTDPSRARPSDAPRTPTGAAGPDRPQTRRERRRS